MYIYIKNMNIVDFLDKQIQKYDVSQKCGFCWNFGAPLKEGLINLQQPPEDKECCVNVMFLQDRGNAFSAQRSFNANTGLINGGTITHNFQLLVVVGSQLGINMYNEIDGYSTDDSIWTTILSKLQNCLLDLNFDFCEFLGTNYRVTNWSATQEINYLDSNFCGYRINVTFARSL